MTDSAPSIGFLYRRLASLPLRMRRRALRAVFSIKTLVGAVRGGRRTGPNAVHLFQRVLRLSRSEARRLEREAALHDLCAEMEWYALHKRSLPGVRRDMARVRIDDPGILARVAETGRPVILAPLHMGAYVIGLACTMLRFFPGRPLLVLRQHDHMAMETQVMERIREFGVEMRFLKVTERGDFLSAVRFAKAGAVIVVFCDLPPSYGSPAQMPMFGLTMRFAFGLDTLARLTGATVVPWSTVMEPDGDVVRIGRPFEIAGGSPEERAQAASLMGAHIRNALRERPEQWHHWALLDEYLPARDTLPSDLPEAGGQSQRNAA